MKISSGSVPLTNLRFADDVLLIAPSLHQLKHMLTDLKDAASQVGLELHPDKTKILTNASKRTGRPTNKQVQINDVSIEILAREKSTKYLGRLITFNEPQETEIDHRIRQAWAKFMKFKQELTNKYYSLKQRIRLFESVVTPTMLYGCQTWTMTDPLEGKIRRCQRRMLRMMLDVKRRQTTKTIPGDSYDTIQSTRPQEQHVTNN
eukprot:12415722-Karenia_brevis.AAC.1